MKKILLLIFTPFIELFKLYKYGFSIMSKESRILWIIAFIKLFIMFGVLKIFFFKDFLNYNFDTQKQRVEYVQKKLTEIKK